MKAANKDLILIAAAALAAYFILGRKVTTGTAAAAQPAGYAPALSPSANANNIRLGQALLGVPDILGIFKSVLPTSGGTYPNDWLSVQTGTDQISDITLLPLENAWKISKSNPFGPAVPTDPSDPYGISDALGFITGTP